MHLCKCVEWDLSNLNVENKPSKLLSRILDSLGALKDTKSLMLKRSISNSNLSAASSLLARTLSSGFSPISRTSSRTAMFRGEGETVSEVDKIDDDSSTSTMVADSALDDDTCETLTPRASLRDNMSTPPASLDLMNRLDVDKMLEEEPDQQKPIDGGGLRIEVKKALSEARTRTPLTSARTTDSRMITARSGGTHPNTSPDHYSFVSGPLATARTHDHQATTATDLQDLDRYSGQDTSPDNENVVPLPYQQHRARRRAEATTACLVTAELSMESNVSILQQLTPLATYDAERVLIVQRQLRLQGGHSLVIGEGNTAYVVSITAAEKMGMRRFCIDLQTASKRQSWEKLLLEAVLTVFAGDSCVVMVRDKPSLLAAMRSGALHALVRLATLGAGQTLAEWTRLQETFIEHISRMYSAGSKDAYTTTEALTKSTFENVRNKLHVILCYSVSEMNDHTQLDPVLENLLTNFAPLFKVGGVVRLPTTDDIGMRAYAMHALAEVDVQIRPLTSNPEISDSLHGGELLKSKKDSQKSEQQKSEPQSTKPEPTKKQKQPPKKPTGNALLPDPAVGGREGSANSTSEPQSKDGRADAKAPKTDPFAIPNLFESCRSIHRGAEQFSKEARSLRPDHQCGNHLHVPSSLFQDLINTVRRLWMLHRAEREKLMRRKEKGRDVLIVLSRCNTRIGEILKSDLPRLQKQEQETHAAMEHLQDNLEQMQAERSQLEADARGIKMLKSDIQLLLSSRKKRVGHLREAQIKAAAGFDDIEDGDFMDLYDSNEQPLEQVVWVTDYVIFILGKHGSLPASLRNPNAPWEEKVKIFADKKFVKKLQAAAFAMNLADITEAKCMRQVSPEMVEIFSPPMGIVIRFINAILATQEQLQLIAEIDRKSRETLAKKQVEYAKWKKESEKFPVKWNFISALQASVTDLEQRTHQMSRDVETAQSLQPVLKKVDLPSPFCSKWRADVLEEVNTLSERSIGDTILLCAAVIYLGPYGNNVRARMLKHFCAVLMKRGFKVTYPDDPIRCVLEHQSFRLDPTQRRHLPPGRMRELSALIILYTGRYPLIHDPDGELTIWIKKNYRFFYGSRCNLSNEGEFIKIQYSGGITKLKSNAGSKVMSRQRVVGTLGKKNSMDDEHDNQLIEVSQYTSNWRTQVIDE